jgi:hypothetical protein
MRKSAQVATIIAVGDRHEFGGYVTISRRMQSPNMQM